MKNLKSLLLMAMPLFVTIMLFAGTAYAAEHKVGMEGWTFNPPKITIKAGDSVLWVNDDDTTHKIVFEDDALGGPTKESPLKIRQGKEFSFTFKKAGVYKYYCVPHRSQDMKGVVIVK